MGYLTRLGVPRALKCFLTSFCDLRPKRAQSCNLSANLRSWASARLELRSGVNYAICGRGAPRLAV
eukprot:9016584-Pyramimonas_sp.AAC.1